MNKFKYVAVTNSGQRINGEKEAESREEIVNFLHSKDLIIVSVDETLGLNFKKLFSSEIGGIPLNDKVVLVKQLSTMVSANIPLIQAVDILIQQTEKDSLKEKLKNIYKSIEAGTTLSDAFKKEGGIFSEVHLNLLAAGEKSANLNEMLEQIAVDLEKSKNLRGKVSGALIYPAIIFTVMIIVIFIMLTTMIPQVKDLYLSLGQTDLPAVTQILVDVGTGLSNPLNLIVIFIIIVTLIILYRYTNSTKKGRETIDRMKLKLPVFGQLSSKAEVAQFCRVTSMLLKSGLQIIETLEVVSNASNSVIFKNIIQSAKEEVIKGSSLAVGLAKYNAKDKAFPLILIKIMGTGEESGKLDKILQDMSVFYENEVEQLANNLTKLMEPLIMVIAGLLVGFLAVAIYLPIFQVGQFVKS